MFGRQDDEPAEPRDQIERELVAHGTAAVATVDSAVVHRSGSPSPDSIRWEFKLTVKPPSGHGFSASFSQDLPKDATFSRPAHVLFDPAKHSRVMIDPAHLGKDMRIPTMTIGAAGLVSGSGQRWSVPEACPRCGAAVDQPVESMKAEPMCHFCNQALPVTEPPRA